MQHQRKNACNDKASCEKIPCSRTVERDEEYCILHLPRDHPLKNIKSFNKAIVDSIRKRNATFNPYYLSDWEKGINFCGIITPKNWDGHAALGVRKKIPLFFECADLSGANLNRISFPNSSFFKANLQNCDLFGVDFTHCDLKYADLRKSNLQTCKLSKAVLWRIRYDRKTNFNYVDCSQTDWSYNPSLYQWIILFQRKEQLRKDSPFIYFLWSAFGDCGISISGVFVRVSIIIFIYYIIYIFFLCHNSTLCIYQKFISSFIFSVSSFFGLSYEPQFQLSETIKLLSLTEGMIGFVMIAILIAIFLGKIRD